MSVVCFCLNICLCYVYSSYNQAYTSVLLQGCNVGFQQNLSRIFNIHIKIKRYLLNILYSVCFTLNKLFLPFNRQNIWKERYFVIYL